MSERIKIELTAIQAKVLFNVVDGAADAGACEDGNTRQEARALQQITEKLLARLDAWKAVQLDKG